MQSKENITLKRDVSFIKHLSPLILRRWIFAGKVNSIKVGKKHMIKSNKMDERKEHLNFLMLELSNSIGENERRYFHEKTTENLIFHFDEIKNENAKKWVYDTLVEYFKKCSEYIPSIGRDTSKKLFLEYLDKITDYYHTNLGFSALMNRGAVYVIYFLILSLCYYFFNIYIVIGVAALFILQIIQSFKKYKEKKVYGLFL